MTWYVDTSALVKLVVVEAETPALRRWLRRNEGEPLVASDLARTELMRAARRASPLLAPRVREVLQALTLLTVLTAVFEAAGRLDPDGLRSLDALHLAAALDLGEDLSGLVTYDERLATAATSYGVRVVSPGR